MRLLRRIVPALLLTVAALSVALGAQTPPPVSPAPAPAPPQAPGDPTPPSVPAEPDVTVDRPPFRSRRPVVRIGGDYRLGPGDAVEEVVVIFGNATIEGEVDQSVVVIFGNAQLASGARVDDALVVVGGSVKAAADAVVREDVVVVGGVLDAPPQFSPGAQHVSIGPTILGARVDAFVPWLTGGLLLGRPIVPGLGWVWAVVAFFFVVYLIINVIFDRPVRTCAMTLDEKPLTAFAVGLLVLLLAGPVSLLLTVSLIGIAVIPFVICALFVAGLVGRIAVARWAGMRLVPEESEDGKLQSLRSFVIGFALLCLAYMVPFLGLVTWAMVGVFGLGAATLAFMSTYRRENPLPLPRPPGDAPPPPPLAPPPLIPQPPVQTPYADAGPTGQASTSALGAIPASLAGAGVDLAAYPRAPFRDRLAAFVLDVILVVIATQVLDVFDLDNALFLVLLAYHIGFWTWKGTTVGGIICQLRVVRIDGTPLRFVDALVRGLASIFSLLVVGLGALWILKDPERQSWHDKIAGTYVVKVPRNFPI